VGSRRRPGDGCFAQGIIRRWDSGGYPRDASPGPPAIFAAQPGTETSPGIDVEKKLQDAFEKGWTVVVWNDPVNLMDYVVHVFKTVLKMSDQDATKHMLEVHHHGKSVVARDTKERSELIVHRLRGFGLNTTMEHT
jgi:ATP-dependent Clp protease adaptor protein ClpS